MSGTRNAPPGNPLATNPAPPPPRLGLDADAMKVLRAMTPRLRAATASEQPNQ